MAVNVFSDLAASDILYLAEAALRTLEISVVAIAAGTVLGLVFGWMMSVGNKPLTLLVNAFLDIFRSVPLIIQLILFDSFIAIAGYPMSAFYSGTIVLAIYTTALTANVVRGGIESVSPGLRRAARSLGMGYWQDMFYVVWPVGLRSAFPSWIGVALSVIKDSALVSVIGYVELLKASQILITRTQDTFLILGIAGLFYFALSYPISKASAYIERRWQS